MGDCLRASIKSGTKENSESHDDKEKAYQYKTKNKIE